MRKLIIVALLMAFNTAAFADSVIVTTTKTWKSVPITVDSTKNIYTVEGAAPTDGDYYYTYPGYRCLREKKDIVGINAVMFHAGVSGGTDIYCYAE